MTNKIYPIIIQLNSKEIQIGHAEISFEDERVFARNKSKFQVKLKDYNIGFRKNSIIGEVVGGWSLE